MKLLPFIVSAVFVAVAVVLTMAVANSTITQEKVTGLHSAELTPCMNAIGVLMLTA